jgi:hypothetical protein
MTTLTLTNTPTVGRVYRLTYHHRGERHTASAQYIGAGWWIIGTWMLHDGKFGVTIEGWSND